MKTTILLLLLITVLNSFIYAQPPIPKSSRAETDSRGFYKTLSKYDSEPSSKSNPLDTLRFPVSEKQKESLKAKPPYYLAADPSLVKVPPPPANSSLQTRKELDYLLQLQQQRSEEDVRASLFYAGVWYNTNIKQGDEHYFAFQKNLFHMGRSIGTWFNYDSLPLTRQLIANAWRDASYFIWYYKYHYARIRPYKIDTRIKNLEETNWAAYPSGHAGNSYVAAYIYSALAPEFADFFIKDAFDMAHSREIIGVHFPSDSESARSMARQVVDHLLKNEKFLVDFEKTKMEWEIVRGRNF